MQEFVNDTKAMDIPVDFVSTHSYPSDGYCSNTDDTGRRLPLPRHRTGGRLPSLITEYKDGLRAAQDALMEKTRGHGLCGRLHLAHHPDSD